MSRAVPSANEVSRAIIINVFTATMGVVIGLMITSWWRKRQTKNQRMPMPGMQGMSDT